MGDRPIVTLKLATSLDGRIALANGASKWITGPESRAEVHRMRAASDAILTGSGTILADNPEFTARPEGGAERKPALIVMDRRGRVPSNARIFEIEGREVEICRHGDLPRAMAGRSRVMIEAGSQIAAAALSKGLVDRIEWFRAPLILGGDGLPVIAALGLERLDGAPIFKRTRIAERGADVQESYERAG